MRLVDADEFERRLMFSQAVYDSVDEDGLYEVISVLDDMPTIDPVRHGHWQRSNPLTDTEECSVCGYNIPTDEFETPYCPLCGAKMDEERNKDDGHNNS